MGKSIRTALPVPTTTTGASGATPKFDTVSEYWEYAKLEALRAVDLLMHGAAASSDTLAAARFIFRNLL